MSNYADNILDKDGNPIYLEDKHLNDQTSQTTVATTDAVMLKDTNGAYHSIAKASFNEAVRAAMGSILTNFDKGTSITRIPGIDSSNDLGSVTAGNLASVLGVNSFANGTILCNYANYGLAYDSYLDTGIKTGLIIATDLTDSGYAQVWFVQGGEINQVADGDGSIGFDKVIELVNRNGTAQFHWRTDRGNVLTGFWIGMNY